MSKNYFSKICFFVITILMNTIFIRIILEKIVSIKSNIFLFPIFSFLSFKYQVIFNILVLLLFLFLFINFHACIRLHILKFIKTFHTFGPLLLHYLFGLILSFFISTLIFKKFYYQKMFIFNGDFIVYLILLSIIFVIIKPKSQADILEFKKKIDTETPIDNPNEDILDFSNTVSNILAYILSQKNQYSATAIGLLGDWGSGKTSLLNLIHFNIKFEKENNVVNDYKRLKVIYFNVSQYDDVNLLFMHFYHFILTELEKEYYLPVIDKFNIFQSVIGTVGKGIKLTAFQNAFLSKPRIENYLKTLSGWLVKLDYTIVVLMDDIDRLLPREMDGVFKLLRIVISNMCNIVLVVSSEQKSLENYVNEFIGQENNG